MPGFTTRTLKAPPAPDPEAVTKAAEQIDIARRALLKAAHHLDDSPTRSLHIEALELKDRGDNLSIRLTEFAGE
jgi:hypothetical protein